MSVFLLFAAICVDSPSKPQEIPPRIREFFMRADGQKEESIQKIRDAIADLEVEIRGAPTPASKATAKRRLAQAEAVLSEMKKSKPFARMPRDLNVDDIGAVGSVSVLAIPSKESLLVRWHDETILIEEFPVKSVKRGDQIELPGIWYVISKDTTDEWVQKEAAIQIKRKRFSVLRPMKKFEIEGFRAAYEAEKK